MATYPIPVFHYKVSWNNQDIGFSDVSGLTQETQVIEYRDGLMSGTTVALKRPGLKKVNNITLKRGIVEKNNDLFNWFNNNGAPNVERRDITISLLNDEGNPVMFWVITQAWPVKCEGPGLKATGNEIAIESIELAHEGLSMKTT
ncbi:MAG: phage tail protein [Segetibacter sp.]|jgi:phage tail-like protein|nr:phage tail protein [Segetibacter sp.]